jgi:hypothetical protein
MPCGLHAPPVSTIESKKLGNQGTKVTKKGRGKMRRLKQIICSQSMRKGKGKVKRKRKGNTIEELRDTLSNFVYK